MPFARLTPLGGLEGGGGGAGGGGGTGAGGGGGGTGSGHFFAWPGGTLPLCPAAFTAAAQAVPLLALALRPCAATANSGNADRPTTANRTRTLFMISPDRRRRNTLRAPSAWARTAPISERTAISTFITTSYAIRLV